MTSLEIVGFVAAFCTTVSFVPQAVKVIRSRNTEALSLLMYAIFTIGVALWLLYGVLLKDTAIVLANAVTLCLALCILCVKIWNDIVQH